MIKVELTFATIDDAHTALAKLNGVEASVSDVGGIEAVVAEKKAAKPTPAAKAKAATTAAFTAPAKGKAKKAFVPSVDETKAKILELAGDDESQPDRVKAYVTSFGVKNISAMTDEQRTEAYNSAEQYFGELESEEEEEEDPMA